MYQSMEGEGKEVAPLEKKERKKPVLFEIFILALAFGKSSYLKSKKEN